ncbi:hypothetical protein [Sphingomonas jaspsi]|uniref:hypothetical protein n=1 Tax=Sphingomonas jaspsi TaxID=392409 RepID=UPI0004B69073|nr:hypothetical protein [Sphingomonas jaspsi]
MSNVHYTLSDTSVTILGKDFVPKTMPHTHAAFDQVVTALKAGNDNEVYRLMDLPAAIADYMQGEIQLVDRTLYYKGRAIDSGLTRRILHFMDEGQEGMAKPLMAFFEKVMENPSRRAVQGLYDWCDRSGLPITPEGDILAWKIVNADYTDCHTGTMDNSIGNVVEQPRNECDEDPDRTCSYGLHFCSTAYLPAFGAYNGNRRVLVVKLHPKDVVAFPRDYNVSKGRACRYEVVGEIPPAKAKDFFPSPVSSYDYSYSHDDADGLEDIRVGERYRTRGGSIAYIDAIDEGDFYYPISGRLDGEEQTWTEGGFFSDCQDNHPFDLVELLDDVVETVEPEEGVKFRLRNGSLARVDKVFDTGAVGQVLECGRWVTRGWHPDGRAKEAQYDLVDFHVEQKETRKGFWRWLLGPTE